MSFKPTVELVVAHCTERLGLPDVMGGTLRKICGKGVRPFQGWSAVSMNVRAEDDVAWREKPDVKCGKTDDVSPFRGVSVRRMPRSPGLQKRGIRRPQLANMLPSGSPHPKLRRAAGRRRGGGRALPCMAL